MKRSGKKVTTDRSFVVALSRGLDVLRAFQPNDGLLGNQEIAARTSLPKPTVSRLTYTLTKLDYLTPVPRFEKYRLPPPPGGPPQFTEADRLAAYLHLDQARLSYAGPAL